MNAFTDRFRAGLTICGVIAAAAGAGIKLMKIQIEELKRVLSYEENSRIAI